MTDQIWTILLSGGLGAVLGAVGGAYGATTALRRVVDRQNDRLIRVETRVGVTQDGGLTGNGLIGAVSALQHSSTPRA